MTTTPCHPLQELSAAGVLLGRERQASPLEGLRDLLLSVTVDEGDHGAAPTAPAAGSNGHANGGGAPGAGPTGVSMRSVLSSVDGGGSSFSEDRL